MKEKLKLKTARVTDPYLDRRSGEDRRQVYDSDYFLNGGVDKRTGKDSRQQSERRDGYLRVIVYFVSTPNKFSALPDFAIRHATYTFMLSKIDYLT